MNIPDYRRQSALQRYVELNCHGSVFWKLRALLNCCKYPVPAAVGGNAASGVHLTLKKKKDGSRRAGYLGVGHCCSRWSCPVCSPYRLNRDIIRLTEVIRGKIEKGYKAIMVTLTIPHYSFQPALEVLDNLVNAKHKWDMALKDFKRLRRVQFTTSGSITSTECKHSSVNGFHFHNHVVYFIPAREVKYFFEMEDELRAMWQKICAPIKQFESTECGLWITKKPLTDARYLAKEMSKTVSAVNQRTGKAKTRDMFELLDTGDPHDFDIFIEYALATRWHARIRCSKGLMVDIDDELLKKKLHEITGTVEEIVLCTFNVGAWNDIVEAEYTDNAPHRWRLLQRAELDGLSGVRRYCWENKLPMPMAPVVNFTDLKYSIIGAA